MPGAVVRGFYIDPDGATVHAVERTESGTYRGETCGVVPDDLRYRVFHAHPASLSSFRTEPDGTWTHHRSGSEITYFRRGGTPLQVEELEKISIEVSPRAEIARRLLTAQGPLVRWEGGLWSRTELASHLRRMEDKGA